MDFKIGDTVVRVEHDNGTLAEVGTRATVLDATDNYILVSYIGVGVVGVVGDEVSDWWGKHGDVWSKLYAEVECRTMEVGGVTTPARTVAVNFNPGPRLKSPLPEDSESRKKYPLYSGLLAYFPAALARVAHHSYVGNEKHNPGLPLQHTRDLSGDHADALLRHLMEADLEGVAWRALALLQEQCESEGAPRAPAAR